MSPHEVREARQFIESERMTAAPFELAIGGTRRRDDSGREWALIASLADAGATWWQEWIRRMRPGVVRAAIARGPLRID